MCISWIINCIIKETRIYAATIVHVNKFCLMQRGLVHVVRRPIGLQEGAPSSFCPGYGGFIEPKRRWVICPQALSVVRSSCS